jgi:RimJ/RimL family protein N-acetyltransferase/uncharacterized SAM-binding protein YcdF (DUF218 family)
MREIKTARLLLRPFTEADYDDLYEFLSQLRDDEFEGYLGITYECGREQLRARLGSEEYYAIVLSATGKVIGNIYCGIREYAAREVGYIVNKSFQRNGYGAEALSAVIDHAFKSSVHRVYAECDPRNTPSWKLLEKVGMRREAHFLQNIFFHTDGMGMPKWKDTYVYAIVNDNRMMVSKINSDNLTDEIVDRILYRGLEDTGERADCVVVLGSTKASQYKIPVAEEAYRNQRAPKILLSGGKVKAFPEGEMCEAEHMRLHAIARGVRPEDLIMDTYARNTVENILGSLMELQREFCIDQVKKVLLVTTSFHMRRSLCLARYLFPAHIEVLPCPAEDTHTRRDNWMESEVGRKRAVDEVEKIVACVKNGLFPDFEL